MRFRKYVIAAAAATAVAGGLAVPAAHAAGDGAKTVSTGYNHTCAILPDNALKCWGANDYGELGQGDTDARGDNPNEMDDNLPAINVGTGRTVKAVSANYRATCAILDDDSLKCWGRNDSGQLGLGDTDARGDSAGEMGDNLPAVNLGTGRTAKAISLGTYSACAILDDSSVKCWGSNDIGELGQGDSEYRGDGAGEMGDALNAVNLGTGRTAKAITVGEQHACAILDNDTVKCWGNNSKGQLGQGDSDHRGDGAGEMGDDLPAIDLGTGRTAKAISGSGYHTCAILDNNSVKCWGNGDSGQLGYGDTNNRGDNGSEMGDNLPAIDLGTGRTAKAISAGEYKTCALLDNDTVKCWGWNYYGELGQGDTNNRGDDSNEMGDNLPAIDLGTGRTAKAISTTSLNHTCALLDNNTIKCWGWGFYGELGNGSTENVGDASGEMGDNLPAIATGALNLPPVLPPTGSNPLVLVIAALGLLGVGSIALRARRRTA